MNVNKPSASDRVGGVGNMEANVGEVSGIFVQ